MVHLVVGSCGGVAFADFIKANRQEPLGLELVRYPLDLRFDVEDPE